MTATNGQTGVQTSTQNLEDLRSIIGDLRLVVTRCEMMQRPDLESDVLDAVWEALVISYYRSFATGKSGQGSKHRRRLQKWHVERLTADHQRTHALVVAERHRQVAHRDDRDDEFKARDELTPQAVKSLAGGLIAGLESMASAEQSRLQARILKRQSTKGVE